MLFKKIYFQYGLDGNYLGKQVSYYFEDAPFLLKAEHCNANGFYLDSTTTNGNRATVPCVQISRRCGPLADDPYNDDGRPPTMMFQMAMPQIEFSFNGVIIEGIEIPNLSWCGHLIQPYHDDLPRCPDATYLSDDERDQMSMPFQLRKRQRIILSNDWDMMVKAFEC